MQFWKSRSKNNAQYVSQTEVKAMGQISNFAKRLIMYAYACAFDVEENKILVDLPQPSGMNIGGADDIKKLCEAGTLLPGGFICVQLSFPAGANDTMSILPD